MLFFMTDIFLAVANTACSSLTAVHVSITYDTKKLKYIAPNIMFYFYSLD